MPSRLGSRKAVFLDRDGTMIEDIGYLSREDQVEFFPWTVDAIRALARTGFEVVVVTNQSAIARGLTTEATVEAIHAAMARVLEGGGARVAAYYYCPHHPDGIVEPYARACDCRKPGRGLIDRAARDLNLDPARSFVVGDKWSDVRLGRAVGAKAILVRSGNGAAEEGKPHADVAADVVVDNLAGAASWILKC